MTVLQAIIMTWVLNRGSGNVLLMIILHGANNASMRVFTVEASDATQTSGLDLLIAGNGYLLTMALTALFLVIRYREMYFAKPHDRDQIHPGQ